MNVFEPFVYCHSEMSPAPFQASTYTAPFGVTHPSSAPLTAVPTIVFTPLMVTMSSSVPTRTR